jgi:hypothetical protein
LGASPSDGPEEDSAFEETTWTVCPDCGTRVKRRNLDRHQQKCPVRHPGAGASDSPQQTPPTTAKPEPAAGSDWEVNVGMLPTMILTGIYLLAVWSDHFTDSFGGKVLLSLGSVCVLFSAMLLLLPCLMIYYHFRKKRNLARSLPPDCGLTTEDGRQLSVIFAWAIVLLSVWFWLFGPSNAPLPATTPADTEAASSAASAP